MAVLSWCACWLVVVRVVRVVRTLVRVPLGGVLDGVLDEVADVRVGQRIEDVLPGASPRDDALGAKQAELLRDRGEPDPGGIRELGDTPFAVAQAVEELQSRDVARRPEDGGGALELL